MTTPRKIGFSAFLIIITFCVGLVAVSPARPPERRFCGHIKRSQDKLPKWVPIPRASHCCQSGRLVNDLKNIWLAQRIYETEHARFATTTDELEQELGTPLRIAKPYQFQSNGTNWSVVVPKEKDLAGNYLLDSSGAIFFHESHIPTPNDLILSKPQQ